MQEAPETTRTSLIQVAEGVYQIAQAQPGEAAQVLLVFSPNGKGDHTASILSEAIWPGTDVWVRDFTEFGGQLEGTAMWPQSTPDDRDPRALIGQFGQELLSATH